MSRVSPIILLLAAILHAADPATRPLAPGELSDVQMRDAALKAVEAKAADATVERVRSSNQHLGPDREIVSPLTDWTFYCGKMGRNRFGDRIRQFLAVSRSGEVVLPVDYKKFAELLGQADKTGWGDDRFLNAAAMFVHLMTFAHEDGWVILQGRDDFLRIDFNMPQKGPAATARQRAAEQIRKPTITHKEGKVIITFDSWHLIGGKLRTWTFEIGEGTSRLVNANSTDLGRFGGGGYD